MALFDLPFTTSLRIRITDIVLTSTAAAVVTLLIGVSPRSYIFGAADTKWLPLPLTIEPGVNIGIATTAGVATAYLIGKVDH
jgi:hypothetical protein